MSETTISSKSSSNKRPLVSSEVDDSNKRSRQRLIVGFTGLAGSGKDTSAGMLCAEALSARGCKSVGRHAFAEPLKEAAAALYLLSDEQLYGSLKNEVDPRWGKTPREILQWLGTDVIRAADPDHFIKLMRYSIEADTVPDMYLVTDVRFDNEAELIKSMGGKLVRVERPSVTRVNDHSSENGVSDHLMDKVVFNDGTMDELKSKVVKAIYGDEVRTLPSPKTGIDLDELLADEVEFIGEMNRFDAFYKEIRTPMFTPKQNETVRLFKFADAVKKHKIQFFVENRLLNESVSSLEMVYVSYPVLITNSNLLRALFNGLQQWNPKHKGVAFSYGNSKYGLFVSNDRVDLNLLSTVKQ